MKPWEITGLVLGLAAFCIALPPLLGWNRARLWFPTGLFLLVAAVALLFLPLPHPAGDVDCGTVLSPRHAWIGPPLCLDTLDCSDPTFVRQCGANRTDRIQTIVVLAVFALGVVTLSGVSLLRRRPCPRSN
ncbi:hypothetical protein [Nocardia jejuensis]|uniref:hypothetical protein n=1 Tax=Nocardia jejuensis TaxID=328049 RepID=UPI000836B573|nr:hypothetical protein [Nocardia jejuensis]